jgi:nucleoporin NUP82
MRLVTFPLNLRAEPTEPVAEGDTTIPETVRAETSTAKEFPETNYANYISANPFKLPAILQRPVGFASIKDIPLPRSHSVKSELVITPETLRYLKAVAERLCSEKHEAVLALSELKARLGNHTQEVAKQMAHCQEIIGRTSALIGPRKLEIEAKLKRLQNEQQALLHRMDRVLQALINKASPELNEHETKWFEELRRMKSQVLGVGRYDQTSLKIRVQQVRVSCKISSDTVSHDS